MSLTRAEHEIKKALVIGLFLAMEDRPGAARPRPKTTRTARSGNPGMNRPSGAADPAGCAR